MLQIRVTSQIHVTCTLLSTAVSEPELQTGNKKKKQKKKSHRRATADPVYWHMSLLSAEREGCEVGDTAPRWFWSDPRPGPGEVHAGWEMTTNHLPKCWEKFRLSHSGR